MGRTVASTDALGNTSTTVYDAAGNATVRIDARGNRVTSVYDALNRAQARIDAVGKRSTSVFDAAGQRIAAIDELAKRTTSVFDDAGRQIATVDRLGNRTSTVFDALGRATVQIDALGNRTTTGYDALGRTTTVRDARAGVTTSAYDAVGNRVAYTDASANTTTSTFDALNRVTAETDPQGGTATTAYDAVGRVSSTTDRLGRRRDEAYDAAGRQVGEAWVSGGVTQSRNTFAYDAVGRRTVAANAAGAYTLAFDAADRVASVVDPFGVTLTFAYDASGNRTRVQDSTGGTTTSAFDAAGRLTSRQLGGSGVTAERVDWSYTARGQVGTITRYSDLAGTTVVARTVDTYDNDGRLTNIVTKTGGGTVRSALTYTLDANDRVTQRQDAGGTATFAYDATDQVTAEGSAVTFGYDATGNRTNAGYATGTGNRVTSDGTWTWTYDAFGAVTKRSKGGSAETWVYGTDFAGRVVSAAKSATDGGAATARVTYVYDVFGNRIESDTWNGTSTTVERYVVDGWDTAKGSAVGTENFDSVLDLDGSNAVTARRVFGAGFDDPVAKQTGGAVTWYVADSQGSVRQVLDNAGAIAGTLTYSAFGVATTATGSVDRYRYTGAQWDATLGLQYNRARLYDPQSGKWLNVDPMGFDAGDTNLYRYVGNRATTGRDPSGKWLVVRKGDRDAWLDMLAKEGLDVEWHRDEVNSYRWDYRIRGYVLLKNPEGWAIIEKKAQENPEFWWQVYHALASRAAEGGKNIRGTVGDDGRFGVIDDDDGDAAQYGGYAKDWDAYWTAQANPGSALPNEPGANPWVTNLKGVGVGLLGPSKPIDDFKWYDLLGPNIPTDQFKWSMLLGPSISTKNLDGEWSSGNVGKQIGAGLGVGGPIKPGTNFPSRPIPSAQVIPTQPGRPGGGIGLYPQPPLVTNKPSPPNTKQKPTPDPVMSKPGSAPSAGTNPSTGFTPVVGPTKPGTGTVPIAVPVPVTSPESGAAPAPTAPPTSTTDDPAQNKPCFVAGTRLWTTAGYRPIADIRAGDFVYSRDEWDAGGVAEPKMVEEVFAGFAGVYNLHVEGQVIGTTAEHPFFAVGRGWTPANQLLPGDHLVCADGTTATVDEVFDTGEWVPVYNLRVADHHTYFVGCDEWGFSVWAHNACLVLVPVTAATGMSYARWAWDERTKQKKGGRPLDDGSKWQTGGGNIGYITLDPNPLARPNFPFISNKNGHAEEHMMNNAFVDGAVKKGGAIIAIFTERSPCNDPNHMCLEKLEKWVAPQKEPDVVYCYYIIQYQGGTKDSQGAELLKAYEDLGFKG